MDHCERCFCYVCDVPAKKCKKWRIVGRKGMTSNHCCAYQGNDDWVAERTKVSPGKPLKIDPPPVVEEEEPEEPPEEPGPVVADGAGPYPPDHEVAPNDETLTQCRKCSWYSRFPHHNFQESAAPTGSHDWCHRCGRVASEKDFGKSKAMPYTPGTADFYLGEKIIPFKLKARDPRNFHEFKQAWEEEKNNWIYDEAEMEEELFRHRFGERPTLKMIMASIPCRKVIPKNGFVREAPVGGHGKSASESEALLLTEHNHKALLQLLYTTDAVATPAGSKAYPHEKAVRGNIRAIFDKETRSGTLAVRLYLPKCAFVSRGSRSFHDHVPMYSNLLGNWYDIYPFSVSSLCGALKAKADKYRMNVNPARKIGNCTAGQVQAMEQAAVDDFNTDAKIFRDKLSLISSSGSKTAGGVCKDDTTLEGCLQRYAADTLAQELFRSVSMEGGCSYSNEYWVEAGAGRVSRHRVTNRDSTAFETLKWCRLSQLEILMTGQDAVLAASNLHQGLLQIVKQTSSMSGMLEQLENIGHKSVEYVEGLNVELLGFQKQALQWALDRERLPDGIQSFWWTKLPGCHQDIYFNPVLQLFRKGKPKVVKGGFIAQEMGLGKTLTSLGLILSNPAPAFPKSGSGIKELDDSPPSSKAADIGWNDQLYSKASAGCPKRGSILCRGTLVVCPVSLVGQWVEEAKSKLKDPGLVYPYHGQSRDRNPLRLAENTIIVTTYQVLASDATYHAKKSGSADYVPPLEMIRFWRIICDESHQMKIGNTQRSQAMMQLVADHKWLVSGTPFNNSFNDLQNQLKFLGVEHAEDMMKEFQETAYHHIGDPGKSRYDPISPCFGNLLFFLRSIMIRHTQKQTYRGTSTTLMSLPKKTERTLEIDFPAAERQHYAALEENARSFYEGLKERTYGQINRHYLALQQKLTQIRIASAGGRYPLEIASNDDEGLDEDDEVENEGQKKKRPKETKYSDFVFEAKLKALVKDLLAAREKDPTSKSLVFSQYSSTLQWLQDELPKYNFQYRTLTGNMSMKQRAKALHDFQGDPPTTIFLLSMRTGAVGINLTQANRVYLMEPSFNPALEDQAIGRVHRLGQKRPTLITRLVVSDSIETRLLQLRKRKQLNEAVPMEEDTKAKAAMLGATSGLIGSVASDRAAMLGEDFDLLYGVKRSPLASAKVPDSTVSFGEI